MRVNYDSKVKIKDVTDSENPLLKRRQKQKGEPLPPPTLPALKEVSQMSIADNSTSETPMTMSRSQTPTNF